MKSKITGGGTEFVFRARLLEKFDVSYFRCNETGFIQTETPYWLNEAYSSAISSLDLGLVSRNVQKAQLASIVIDRALGSPYRFIDYGGGYGMFTRLMRDRGFDFVNYDAHCKNLFAYGSHIENLKLDGLSPYDLLTAWEVFEHLESPIDSLTEMLNVANVVFFSTELIPQKQIKSSDDWWYFAPEFGQHISFYTLKSLQYLATKFSLHFYSDNVCNHIFSKHPLEVDPFTAIPEKKFIDRLITKIMPRDLVENAVRLLSSRFSADRYLERLYPTRRARKSLLESDFQAGLLKFRSVNRPHS
jgi:hypothetical protein